MILVYAAACAAVLAWRLRARWRAWSAKRAYERVETAFRDIERVCKADEVQLGRPVDYAEQLRLLKAFDLRERGRMRWTKSVNVVARTNRWWSLLKGFHGRRTSYLSGALDVGMVWYLQRNLASLIDSAQLEPWFDVVKRLW